MSQAAVIVNHKTSKEATDKFKSFLNEVARDKTNRGFLAVTFYVDSNGNLQYHRTTWQFPTDAWPLALQALKKIAMNDRPSNPNDVPAPLPLADKFANQNEVKE